MSENIIFPRSAKDTIDDLLYFPRLTDKIRLHAKGELHEDYHPNLGKALDLMTCQLLKVEYADLVEQVKSGADDRAVLDWAYATGNKPESPEKEWWCSHVRNLGFRDYLSERLAMRKESAGLSDRSDIYSFMDFMDAEEGRDPTNPA